MCSRKMLIHAVDPCFGSRDSGKLYMCDFINETKKKKYKEKKRVDLLRQKMGGIPSFMYLYPDISNYL